MLQNVLYMTFIESVFFWPQCDSWPGKLQCILQISSSIVFLMLPQRYACHRFIVIPCCRKWGDPQDVWCHTWGAHSVLYRPFPVVWHRCYLRGTVGEGSEILLNMQRVLPEQQVITFIKLNKYILIFTTAGNVKGKYNTSDIVVMSVGWLYIRLA